MGGIIKDCDRPGWRPTAENTDRAQLSTLGDSATIRPDSATATVESLLRRAGVGGVPEAVAIPAWGGAGEWEIRRRIEAQWAAMGATRATVKESLTVAEDPRPICRGPGGIRARRMRRAGLAVRGGR